MRMLKQSASHNGDGVASDNNPDYREVNNSKSMDDMKPREEGFVDQISDSVIHTLCPGQTNYFSPKQTPHTQTASRDDSQSRNHDVYSQQRVQHTETMVPGDDKSTAMTSNWCNACPDGIRGNFTGQIFRENAEDSEPIVKIKGRGLGSRANLLDDVGSSGTSSPRRNSPQRTYHPQIKAKVMATADGGKGEREDKMDTIAISNGTNGSTNDVGNSNNGSPRRTDPKKTMKTARRNSITKDDVVVYDREQSTRPTVTPLEVETNTDSGCCLCCPRVDSIPTSAFLCLTLAAAIP